MYANFHSLDADVNKLLKYKGILILVILYFIMRASDNNKLTDLR